MVWCLRCIPLIAVIALNCGATFGQDTDSANYVMPACRATLNRDLQTQVLLPMSMLCAGLVEGIHFAASGVCHDQRVTREQVLRVVVKYIDDRPARLNENFKALALEALQAAWPCRH
jgi:hypothetical protein